MATGYHSIIMTVVVTYSSGVAVLLVVVLVVASDGDVITVEVESSLRSVESD